MIDEVGNPQDGGPNEALQILRSKDFKERLKRVSAQPKPAAPNDALERLRSGDFGQTATKPAEAPAPETPPFPQAPPQQAAAGGASSITPPTTPPAPTPQPAPAGGMGSPLDNIQPPIPGKFELPPDVAPLDFATTIDKPFTKQQIILAEPGMKKASDERAAYNAEQARIDDLYRSEFSAMKEPEISLGLKQNEKIRSQIPSMEQAFGAGLQRLQQTSAMLDAERAAIEQMSGATKEQYDAAVAAYNSKLRSFKAEQRALELESAVISDLANQSNINELLLLRRDREIKSEVGNVPAAMAYSALDVLGKSVSGALSIAGKIIPTDQQILEFAGLAPKGSGEASMRGWRNYLEKVEATPTYVTGIDQFVTPEYIEKTKDESLFKGGLITVAEMTPAIASSIMVGNPAMAATFFTSSYRDLENEMQGGYWDQVSGSEKEVIKIGTAFVSAGLSTMGMKALAGKLPVVNEIFFNAAKKFAPGMTAGQLRRVIDAETRSYVTNVASKLVQGFAIEGTEELLDYTQEEAVKHFYEEYKRGQFGEGADTLFQNAESMEGLAEGAWHSFVLGGIAGDIMAGSLAAATSVGAGSRLNNKEFEAFQTLLRSGSLKRDMEPIMDAAVRSGKMDRSEYDKYMDDLSTAEEVMSKIPEDLEIEATKEAFDLLSEKARLSKMEKALVAGKIAAIDEKLAALPGARPKVGQFEPKAKPSPEPAPAETPTSVAEAEVVAGEPRQENVVESLTQTQPEDGGQAEAGVGESPLALQGDAVGASSGAGASGDLAGQEPAIGQVDTPVDGGGTATAVDGGAAGGLGPDSGASAIEEPATGRAPVVESGAAEQPAATPEEQPDQAVKAPKPKAPKKNVNEITLTLDEAGVSLIKRTPTFRRMFSDGQLAALKAGENKLSVNNTALGNIERTFGGKVSRSSATPTVSPESSAPTPAPKVADAAKPRAGDRLRSMKIDTSKLEGLTFSSPIPIPPKKIAEAINGAIEVAATILDAYGSAADAISSAKEYFRNNDWYKNLSTSDKQKANAAFRKHVEPAVNEAAATVTQEEPTPDGERKVLKTFEGRRFYGGSFREEVKEEVKKAGLYRAIESQVEAKERAVKFIEAVGIDAAVEAVRNNGMEGGAAAYVWDEALRMLDQQILESEDVAISEELVAKQAEMVQKIGKMQLAAGRFNSAWGNIIKSSDLGYHSEKKAKEWEEQFGERPSEEVMEAWRKRDEELARLKKLIEAAEKRAEDAEAKLAVDGIAESVSRENEQRKTGRYSQRAKRMADQLRTLKAKPIVFLDADGNPIEITKLGSVIPIDINAIIEAGARAIEKTGQIADAIAAMSEMLSKEKWFSSLDDRNKMAVLRQLEDQAKATFDSFGTERIKVPIAMIRSAVGAGIRDIDSLVKVIKEQLSDQYPDASDREIRDAITGYGKVVNMSKDEISVEIRRMKDIGRILSALEDVENKIRPMRSGLQRDKLDAEQRALRNKLRDALRDLPLDQAENERLLKTALEAAKTRARNRIEDIQRQIDNKERETRKRTVLEPDNELKALLKEKELLEQEMERVFGPRVISEETRVQTALSSIRRSIEEYERRIAANDLDPKKQPRSLESPELKIARENLDKVRDDYKKLQDEAGVIDRRRTEAAKKATKARIAELEERIKNQDFSKKPVRKTIADDELTALRAEKERIKEEYDTDFYREMLRNRSWGQVAGDRAWQAWDLLRMVQATADLSFILIQGGNMTISNMWRRPDVVAGAFRNMFKAFKSEKYSEQFIRNIKAQPWYQQAKEAGLAITHPHAELSAREELFMSDWTRIFWSGVGSPLLVFSEKAYERWMNANPARALERAGGAYLNTIRIERYLEGVEMLERKKADINGKEVTAQDYKDIADAINTLTGRASLGFAEPMSKGLSKAFFSPRMWASVIKTATPYGLYYFSRLSPTARKMALLDMARYVGTTASIVALAAYALANDDDDETYVETDMRSSDFGKIRLGDMRIDPWGGKVQQVVASTRLSIGAISLFMDEPLDAYKRTDGRISPLGKGGAPTLFDVGLNMALNKLSPSASFLVQASRTTLNKYNERRAPFEDDPYEIGAAFQGKLVPIYFSTVADLMADDPGALEGFLLFYSFLGGGVQNYGDKGAKLDQSIPAPAFTGRRIEQPR